MENVEHLPIELDVTLSAVTIPLRHVAQLQPGSFLPCLQGPDGLLALTGGGEVLGYGRLESEAGTELRLVTLAEIMG